MSDNANAKVDETVSAILTALERRDAAKSVDVDKVAKGFGNAKTIVQALGLFGVLVSGGVLTFSELQAKPTQEDVVNLIRKETAPIEEKANEVESVKSIAAETQKDVDRIEQVLEYQIQRDAWRDDVVDHKLARKRGPAPSKPESLRAKERKLLGISK
jgi:hypothetical protein